MPAVGDDGKVRVNAAVVVSAAILSPCARLYADVFIVNTDRISPDPNIDDPFIVLISVPDTTALGTPAVNAAIPVIVPKSDNDSAFDIINFLIVNCFDPDTKL